MIEEIKNSEEFENEIKSNAIVFADFYATWCPPCKALSPIVEEIEKENADIKFLKINVDDEQELAIEYGIMSVPTLVFIKNGEPVNKRVGLISKKELQAFLNKNK